MKENPALKIFVTGATGVMGKVLVPQLLAAGHTVTALSRSPRNEELLNRLGAQPITIDLFAVDALTQILRGYDAIFHLATKIPPMTKMRRLSTWEENDRLRREGTRNLVTAALAAETVHTMIYPS